MIERIRAEREMFSDKIALRLMQEQSNGRYFAQPLVMTRREETSIIEPFIHLEKTTAQALMDELWNCGLRPSEGSGSAGEKAAMQEHLKDLRRIIFKDKL